jgi:hypothetical protein
MKILLTNIQNIANGDNIEDEAEDQMNTMQNSSIHKA